MLKTGFAAALVAGALGFAGAATAAPAGPSPLGAAPITQVADGCGPGFFRGPAGFCRPFRGGYGPGYGGPRFYGPPPRFYGPPVHYGPPRFYGPRW